MELNEIVDRKHEVRMLPPAPQFVKQRIAKAAEELNRAGDMAAHVEIANEALCKLAVILYQCDSDGVYANIDNRTHRLLIPAPWGSLGWKHWEVRKWEAEILRAILMARVVKPRHIALFDYSAETRTWHLNIVSYPALDKAQAYLQHCAVTLTEWRMYADKYTASVLARRQKGVR